MGLLLTACAAFVVVFARSLTLDDHNLSGGLIAMVAIFTITVPVAFKIGREEGDPYIRNVILVALALKTVGTILRYLVAFDLYDGRADAARYDQVGAALAEQFRQGDFDLGDASLVGTRFIEVVTGLVYTLLGTSRLAGYAMFSWFGFIGLLFAYRAFRTAVAGGDNRLYAVLVLLLPSLLFWPSGIGKEAWMMLGLGVASYGAARYLTSQRGGITRLVLGLWAAAMVRPHVVLLFLAGLGVAAAYRPTRFERSLRSVMGPITKVVVVLGVVVAFAVVTQSSEERFGVGQERRADSLVGVRDYTTQQSTQGGSEFEATPVNSPLDFPVGFVSVLYRPFPFEARNGQMMVSAIEGVVLLGFTLKRRRSIIAGLKEWRTSPYVTVAASFMVGFVWAFSSFGNFGILVRQRVQVYPFIFVMLCLPQVRRQGRAAARAAVARARRTAARRETVDAPVRA